jgi:hypothetical protein
MRQILFRVLAGLLAAFTLTAPLASAAPPLSTSDLVKLRTLIRPAAGEDPFDTIPWETSLWDARKKAAAAGKPILLWEMDGHPLGCG